MSMEPYMGDGCQITVLGDWTGVYGCDFVWFVSCVYCAWVMGGAFEVGMGEVCIGMGEVCIGVGDCWVKWACCYVDGCVCSFVW